MIDQRQHDNGDVSKQRTQNFTALPMYDSTKINDDMHAAVTKQTPTSRSTQTQQCSLSFDIHGFLLPTMLAIEQRDGESNPPQKNQRIAEQYVVEHTPEQSPR